MKNSILLVIIQVIVVQLGYGQQLNVPERVIRPSNQSALNTTLTGWSQTEQKVLHVLSKSDHTIYSYLPGVEITKEVFFDGRDGTLFAPFDIVYLPDTKELLTATPKRNKVKGFKMDNKALRELPIEETFSPVDIEIDASNNKIYWLDHLNNRIYRSNLDGKNKKLIQQDSIDQSLGIAVSPQHNLLFWTSLNAKRIFRSDLNGKNIKVLVDQPVVSQPIRLAVHDATQEVFWTDDDGKVGKIKFDGSGLQWIFSGSEENHPFAILINDESGKIYWSDYGDRTVKWANLDGSEMETIVSDINEPLGLVLTDFTEPLLPFNIPSQSNLTQRESFISIFPNPSNGAFRIVLKEALKEGGTIRILDGFGQTIKEIPNFHKEQSINLSSFPNGYYSCLLFAGDRIITKTFVLSK